MVKFCHETVYAMQLPSVSPQQSKTFAVIHLLSYIHIVDGLFLDIIVN